MIRVNLFPETMTCTKCGCSKAAPFFSSKGKTAQRHRQCITCRTESQVAAHNKRMSDPNCRARYFQRQYERRSLRLYGVTPEDIEMYRWQQDERCAICGIDLVWHSPGNRGPAKNSASIDHDHKTGEARGILCSSCNHGLGMFKDNIAALKQAILYLETVGYWTGPSPLINDN